MKSILVSDMLFSGKNRKSMAMRNSTKILFIFSLWALSSFLPFTAHTEVLDRVVAIVDDEAIMLSELEESLDESSFRAQDITREEVLQGLVNRVLLLKEAARFLLMEEAEISENELINKYIQKRLKAFINIHFDESESYYVQNKEYFGDKEFHEVRDEIERFLIEKKLNKVLLKHLEDLRRSAYIRIQLSQ